MVTLRKPAEQAGASPMLPYNVLDANCPTRLVLDRLGDKWALLLLYRLQDGPTRFNSLRRDVMGISQKVLSQVLKRLERDGLISRAVFPTVPVTVEYTLTPLGATLTDTVGQLTRWAEVNMPAIADAQERYDAAKEAV